MGVRIRNMVGVRVHLYHSHRLACLLRLVVSVFIEDLCTYYPLSEVRRLWVVVMVGIG